MIGWPSKVGHWILSNDGVAVAQWVSALLSLGAIILALILFSREQARANREAAEDRRRETEAIEVANRERAWRSAKLQAAIARLQNGALQIMEEDLPAKGSMYVLWQSDQGKPLELRSISIALEALTLASSEDVDSLVHISSMRSILEATINPPGLPAAVPVETVLSLLRRQAAALRGPFSLAGV